ncbi:hypothetical protein L2E82_12697 [Cichorium intybus]|uniref:Uncharacterized protein n=1 Tax=Cichorium intybus TaxID=13427 RepID=A0ACB9GGT0_CICIN|nr:hypothetical protein L2E82_12697 [Cichorium intybus]
MSPSTDNGGKETDREGIEVETIGKLNGVAFLSCFRLSGNPLYLLPGDTASLSISLFCLSVTEPLRNQDFEKRTSDAANPRGGGGGRGRGRSEHLAEKLVCVRGNQVFGNDPSNSDSTESTSGTTRFRLKPLYTSTEVIKNTEPLKPFVDESSTKTVDISPLLAKIKDKERELKLRDSEIEGLRILLNKATTELSLIKNNNKEMILNMEKLEVDLEQSYHKEIEGLRIMLNKTTTELSLVKNNNEEMILNMDKLEVDLEQSYNEEIEGLRIMLNKTTTELSLVKNNNEEMILNMNKLKEDLGKCRNELSSARKKEAEISRMYLVMKNNFKELEEANENADAEIEKMKLETEQWRKLRDSEIEGLRIMLNKATTELSLVKNNNEEMILNMDKLEEDLEKCRNELSSARKKEAEISRMYLVMKNNFKELEEANETADAEIEKMKLETEQWRKAAKAIAVVLDGGDLLSYKKTEVESLVLYYSNRAAKRMSLGKIRKALDDCRIAARLDPSFLKVCLTAGNCYLELGELDDAMCNYKKCLESGVVCLDRRLTIEASEGLHKAEKVAAYIKQSSELLGQKTSESATNALEIIMEAMSISRNSDKLVEMAAMALFLLHRYDEAVQLCEKTGPFAEKNYHNISNEAQKQQMKLWRWQMMARSYFRMGSFDMALVTLEKYEQLVPEQTKTEGSSSFSLATVSELLRCKSAGNEAYKSGRHKEAVNHYSRALQMSIESRSFAAICLCNRAAAHQALGEVVDAIADCNLAIALDGNYLKAISRRANLHEKIRDYEHATLDLQRLITLLENHEEDKHEDLIVARRRLSSMSKHLKKGMTLDLYLILGLKGSESGAEIKKAYHKAALRHHPDKAGKFLTRCESGADGDVWKEIFETIHKDANKLFKLIGEAYAVLSDANKRFNFVGVEFLLGERKNTLPLTVSVFYHLFFLDQGRSKLI